MSSSDVWLTVFVVIGPTASVLVAGIVKGYRLKLKLDRPERKRRWGNDAKRNPTSMDVVQYPADRPNPDASETE